MTNYDDLSGEEKSLARDIEATAVKEATDSPPVDSDDALSSDHVMDWADAESLASWNLKRIRKALGVSQQQISERLAQAPGGVRLAQTQIAKIERGERPWRLNELFAISEALNVEWREFFDARGASDDPKLVLLAARLKYQEAEQHEEHARRAWHDAAKRRVETGLEMSRTAAKLGVTDQFVIDYLTQASLVRLYLEVGRTVDSIDIQNGGADRRYTSAQERAKEEWAELLRQYRKDGNGDE